MAPAPPEIRVGSIVEFIPLKSAHAGKIGIVSDFVRAAVKAPQVRVRVKGHTRDVVVPVAALRVVVRKFRGLFGQGDKRSKDLVQVEQFDALHERFGDLRAQVRAGGFQQNKLFPPGWLEDVGETASLIPSYEIQRFEKRRLQTLDDASRTAAATMHDGKPRFSSSDNDAASIRPPPSEANDEDEEEAAAPAQGSALKLRSLEHVSWGLQQRLEKGQASDEQQLVDAVNACHQILDSGDNLAEKGIKPLMLRSESQYLEFRRDAASVLYSLSINSDNKLKFLESKALPTIVMLARSTDIDIRLNIAGAIYRLCMHPDIKRPFVEVGVLESIVSFMSSTTSQVGRDLQRNAAFSLKELVENAENRQDVLQREKDLLPYIFDTLKHPDSRVRKQGAWTLEKLGKEDMNKRIMLSGSNLERLLSLLSMRNPEMRRAGASCLMNLTTFGDLWDKMPEAEATQTASMLLVSLKPVLQTLRTETESAAIIDLCIAIKQTMGHDSKAAAPIMLANDALIVFAEQAERLYLIETATSEVVDALRQIVDTLLVVMKESDESHLLGLLPYVTVLLSLCKHINRRIRRGSAKMLAQLSTLAEAKEELCQRDTVADTLALFTVQDHTLQLVAAKILAELAEMPSNRYMLVQQAKCLPPMVAVLHSADDEMRIELIRMLADLAEHCKNREDIAYALNASELFDCLQGGDTEKIDGLTLQGHVIRLVANLVAPAGTIMSLKEPVNESTQPKRFSPTGRNTHVELVSPTNVNRPNTPDGPPPDADATTEEEHDDDGDDDEKVATSAYAIPDPHIVWTSDEMLNYQSTHNRSTIDKIHKRIAQRHVFKWRVDSANGLPFRYQPDSSLNPAQNIVRGQDPAANSKILQAEDTREGWIMLSNGYWLPVDEMTQIPGTGKLVSSELIISLVGVSAPKEPLGPVVAQLARHAVRHLLRLNEETYDHEEWRTKLMSLGFPKVDKEVRGMHTAKLAEWATKPKYQPRTRGGSAWEIESNAGAQSKPRRARSRTLKGLAGGRGRVRTGATTQNKTWSTGSRTPDSGRGSSSRPGTPGKAGSGGSGTSAPSSRGSSGGGGLFGLLKDAAPENMLAAAAHEASKKQLHPPRRTSPSRGSAKAGSTQARRRRDHARKWVEEEKARMETRKTTAQVAQEEQRMQLNSARSARFEARARTARMEVAKEEARLRQARVKNLLGAYGNTASGVLPPLRAPGGESSTPRGVSRGRSSQSARRSARKPGTPGGSQKLVFQPRPPQTPRAGEAAHATPAVEVVRPTTAVESVRPVTVR